ncbi:hypothetical protein Taro_039650 [Colocasia esculenta]|uniref:Uncharacterized protein n=1 Tax=Colocasia esculenta TaxID=4460 RepID=A0A843W6Y9_COLES|nr:hypothetical protein [Colocasia esculenta]
MFYRCTASLHDSCACCRLQLLLCRVRGECGRSACSCRSGAVGAGLAGSGLPCVDDACQLVQVRCSWSSSAHLSVCASRRLREPAYGVAFTGAGLLPMEPVEESEVCCWFGWCVLEGFSQSGALVVLVEVLPGPACVASAVLLAAVFSLMVRVLWSWGLCILVKVLPRIALCRFWQRFFPGVLCLHAPVSLKLPTGTGDWLEDLGTCGIAELREEMSWRGAIPVGARGGFGVNRENSGGLSMF